MCNSPQVWKPTLTNRISNEMRWVDAIREFYTGFEVRKWIAPARKCLKSNPNLKRLTVHARSCGNDLSFAGGAMENLSPAARTRMQTHRDHSWKKIGVTCPMTAATWWNGHPGKVVFFLWLRELSKLPVCFLEKPVSYPCPNCGGLLVVAQ
jgi:hypothetical protein